MLSLVNRITQGDLSETLGKDTDNCGISSAMCKSQRNLRERREADKIAAAENTQLRKALEYATANVMVANENNNIVFINKSANDLFSTTETEIRKNLSNFSPIK